MADRNALALRAKSPTFTEFLMLRRTVAMIALLFVGLLAHVSLGHHGEAPSLATEFAAGGSDLVQDDSTGSDGESGESANSPDLHHGPVLDDAALSSSRGRAGSAWSGADLVGSPDTLPAAVQQDAPAHRPALARTARHSCNPAAGTVPTPHSLQTFRC